MYLHPINLAMLLLITFMVIGGFASLALDKYLADRKSSHGKDEVHGLYWSGDLTVISHHKKCSQCENIRTEKMVKNSDEQLP
jgi:hypothetical protein